MILDHQVSNCHNYLILVFVTRKLWAKHILSFISEFVSSLCVICFTKLVNSQKLRKKNLLFSRKIRELDWHCCKKKFLYFHEKFMQLKKEGEKKVMLFQKNSWNWHDAKVRCFHRKLMALHKKVKIFYLSRMFHGMFSL